MKTKFIFFITFFISSLSFADFNQSLNLSYNKINGQYSNLLAVDIYTPTTGENFPVVIFVHGGGWTEGDKNRASHFNKRNFFVDNGFIFVSINYRLAPEVSFPVYPEDVAQAVAFVFNWIGKYKGNNNKIYLMGHSAGAHLAALVATDEKYLQAYNYNPSDIKGVILLDGAGYDIPTTVTYQSNNGNQNAVAIYENAFGNLRSVWEDASPINHVSSNAPPHILFYVDTRMISFLISDAYYDELIQYNNSKIVAVPNSSHNLINQNFGAENDEVAQQALNFIQNL